MVAPLVGAWIEIYIDGLYGFALNVAPLVGAWIEIVSTGNLATLSTSLPSWERGLKLIGNRWYSLPTAVAPLVGAWIEMQAGIICTYGQGRRSPRGSVD